MNNKKQIVIIGAGFAGLKLARTLNNHPDYCITLIDKNNSIGFINISRIGNRFLCCLNL